MKKIILSVLAACALSVTPVLAEGQGDASQFVSDYTNFVDYMTTHRKMSRETRERADSIFDIYNKEFDRDYRSGMTEEQRAQYYEAKGRYEGVMLRQRGQEAARKAEAKGEKTGKKLKHKGKRLVERTDTVATNVWGKVKDKSIDLGKKAGKLGRKTGDAVENGYDESAAWLRGLFDKKQ